MKIAIPLPVFAAQSNLHFPGNYLQPLDINVSFCHNAINKKHILQQKSCPLLIEMLFPPDKIQLFNSVSFNVHILPSFAVQLHVQACIDMIQQCIQKLLRLSV